MPASVGTGAWFPQSLICSIPWQPRPESSHANSAGLAHLLLIAAAGRTAFGAALPVEVPGIRDYLGYVHARSAPQSVEAHAGPDSIRSWSEESVKCLSIGDRLTALRNAFFQCPTRQPCACRVFALLHRNNDVCVCFNFACERIECQEKND